MMGGMLRTALAAVLGCCVAAAPASASAFCGFYVSTASGALTNRATTVVLMREGARTVLSMQNDYEGPPQDFAMVVPVPVVLHRGDVKTLPRAAFERVDKLAAPRLVEVWEQDPCAGWHPGRYAVDGQNVTSPSFGSVESRYTVGEPRVWIEASFAVGEYDVEVLGARDSAALETWLRGHDYKIPEGAAAALRPYVQAGMKFFVAKVALGRVQRDGRGRVTLSPLRFHYESERFALPVRLGLLNSAGSQDLVVHILARSRYQAANRPNVAIPTNLDLVPAAREAFPAFYAALFDRAVADAPGAVVTEYAWQASACDPCPVTPLDDAIVAQLGGDVLWPAAKELAPDRSRSLVGAMPPNGLEVEDDDRFQPTERRAILQQAAKSKPPALGMSYRWPRYGLVLTRLHLRYGPEELGDDLVFQTAPPIVGGREELQGDGRARRGVREGRRDAFQARYVVRHPWAGPIACPEPRRNVWGADPGGGRPKPQTASDLAFVARGAALTEFLVAEPETAETSLPAVPPYVEPTPSAPASGCARCDVAGGASGVALLVGLLALRRRRR
jgi:hypothetical protein